MGERNVGADAALAEMTAAARLLAGRFLGDGKRSLPFGRAYWVRCGLCSAALCLCALLEYAAVPALVRLVAPLF